MMVVGGAGDLALLVRGTVREMTDTEETARVVRTHVDNVRKWDLAAIAGDYAEDAILLMTETTIVGRSDIMNGFAKAPQLTGFTVDSERYEGDVAVVAHHSNDGFSAVDTFVVRNGMIARQTVVPLPSSSARPVARHWAHCLSHRRGAEAMDLLHEDVRFTIIGSTPLSGEYSGRKDVLERLMPKMLSFPQAPQVSCNTVIAEGNCAVALGAGRGRGPFGRYEQPHYAWAIKVNGNKITELTEYLDTVMIETAAFGTQLVRRGS